MKELIIENIIASVKGDRRFSQLERIRQNVIVQSYLAAVQAIGELSCPKTFVIDKDNSQAIWHLLQWVEGSPNARRLNAWNGEEEAADLNKGIFLGGPTGTGKSLLMNIICELCRTSGITYRLDGKEYPLCWRTYRASEICTQFCKDGLIEPFTQPRILCIQDLGSEPQEVLYMGNRIPLLRQIIEERGDKHGYITHFTSNYRMSSKYLEQYYGTRVASRLHAMCNYIELQGKDRRKATQNN